MSRNVCRARKIFVSTAVLARVRNLLSGLFILLLLGVGWGMTASVGANEYEATSETVGDLRFQQFLSFDHDSLDVIETTARPAAGCSMQPSYESALPDLEQWMSWVARSADSRAPSAASREAVVLVGTGYNYRRSNHASGALGRP